jgi:dTDP-4-dehydrorhamnose reductase
MSKIPLLGTGLTGLVGSKFVEMYSDVYAFTNLDLASGVDITNQKDVHKAIVNHPSKVVVHFAAFTDVTKANEEQGDKNGMVYKVNVLGTQNIVNAIKSSGRRLIHISTAYVFDGEKKDPYVETDATNPIEWYGQTKAYAEEVVLGSAISAAILRIDQPYRQDDFPRLDILHRVKKGLEEGTLPPMFINHTFTATKIEEFADILQFFVEHELTGIYHATTDQVTTDYEFALNVKKQFNLPGEVKRGDLDEYLKRTNRPYQRNTALDTTKLKAAMK